jgi:dethiobiotin synthetase
MAGKGLFVTGTDTGVGKTAVTVAIVRKLVQDRGLRVGVYKPVSSGVEPGRFSESDAGRLWEAAGRPLSIEAVCPQMFAAAISPPRSARAEGRLVDEQLLRDGFDVWRDASDIVIVEGAGGLLSPLGDTLLNADLALDLGLPLVVVDAARLGSIGRTLAIVEAAAARGLRLAAVVLSQVEPLVEDRAKDLSKELVEESASDFDDPTSGWAIARDSASDLTERLRPVPVVMLGHNAASLEPDQDWQMLSRGEERE